MIELVKHQGVVKSIFDIPRHHGYTTSHVLNIRLPGNGIGANC